MDNRNRINNKKKIDGKKRKKKKRISASVDVKILYSIVLLLAIGLVMIFSASAYHALYEFNDPYYFLKKQIVWVILGISIMCIIMLVDYRFWKKFSAAGYVITLLPLVYVLSTEPIMGATRWIEIGPLSFQPSELAKYMMVFFLAYAIEKYRKVIRKSIIVPIILIMIPGIYAALILAENNLSITAVVMIVGVIMIFVAGIKMKHLIPIGTVGLIGGFYFMVSEEYRLKRFLTFMDPWSDMTGDGYQIIHSFYALGSGGLLGQGLGASKQKLLYIPEPQNDFIFSIIGEEFGLIGCIVIIAVFAFLIFHGIKVASKVRDRYAKLLAVGIISVIAIQCLINVAVVTGSMPVTGVPLPFISYGGTSLVFNMAAMGVLLNISKQANREALMLERKKAVREKAKLEQSQFDGSFINKRY